MFTTPIALDVRDVRVPVVMPSFVKQRKIKISRFKIQQLLYEFSV